MKEYPENYQFTANDVNMLLARLTLENLKLSKQMKTLKDSYDDFAKNTGEAVEQFFFDYFEHHLKMGDVDFERARDRMRGPELEYDIVLSNGKYVGIIECKHKFHPKDLEKLVSESLPKFKIEFPKYHNCKIVAGIATYVLVEDVKQLALEHGLYIYTQHAEKVKLQNSKSFKVKYY